MIMSLDGNQYNIIMGLLQQTLPNMTDVDISDHYVGCSRDYHQQNYSQ